MRYGVRDLPHLLRTPLGRMEFANGVRHRSWPLHRRLARRHRLKKATDTRVVAVVGSYGKTTTTRAIISALGCRMQQVLGLNCWNHVADALLKVRPDDRHAVFEVGIDGVGQMEQYAHMVQPDVTVVTSIGSEHHRSLGDLTVTRHEKAHMVRVLSTSGKAVLNGDDDNVRWMAEESDAPVITFGLEDRNHVWAGDIVAEGSLGTTFRLNIGERSLPLRTKLVGRHMLYPLLAAAAVVHAEDLELGAAVDRLQQLAPTPGRMHPVVLDIGATLIRDDYKSSLETVHAALDAFAPMQATRKIVVLGEVSEPPGSQGPIYREIGGRLAEMAELVIVIGPNFQRYAAGAAANGMSREALLHADGGVLHAARMLAEHIRDGDLVLVKGRDTQRLERISCVLQDIPVRCDVSFCPTRITSCENCPMLRSGWKGRRVVI